MGITRFVIFLFVISIVFLSINKKTEIINIEKDEKPVVSFFDSIMYEITTQSVTQVVQSKEAYSFKDKDKLIDAMIVVKSENNETKIDTNIVSAKEILKIDDYLYLKEDVDLQLSNNFNIKTQELDIDIKNKIATNKVAFEVTKETDKFIGDTLYLNGINNHIIAKNTHFKIKVEDNE
ncbi:MAG: hypothetical protein U9R37_03020 [Campylobacterota bacterium]|nr:hypothetical protein [Campylobacterota bacterium]